jgi:hypothetical protein
MKPSGNPIETDDCKTLADAIVAILSQRCNVRLAYYTALDVADAIIQWQSKQTEQ